MADEFSGSGTVTYKFPTGDIALKNKEAKFSYQFSISNELWQISVENIDKHCDISCVDVSFDGTNICRVTTLSEQSYNSITNVDKQKTTNITAEVFPTDVPPSGFFPIVPIWLAYCSGPSVAKSSGGGLRPLWQFSRPSFTSLDFYVKTQFTWLTRKPPLLSECTEFSDGKEYAVQDERPIPIIKPVFTFSGPWSNGFPRIKYWVVQTTNLGDSIFPKQFCFQQLMPDRTAPSGTNLQVLCEYAGILDDLEYNHSNVKFGNGIKRNTSVVDYRTLKLTPARDFVPYVNPVDYLLPITPGYLPYNTFKQFNDAEVHLPTSNDLNRRRIISTRIMIILLLLPAAFYIFFRSRNVLAKTNQKK